MVYDVVISPEAEDDLDRAIRYLAIELGNPQAASALADKVEACLCNLATMPERFSLCKDAVLRAHGYRRVPIGNYVIVYRIDEAARRVLIVHFYHTLQDYEKALLQNTPL